MKLPPPRVKLFQDRCSINFRQYLRKGTLNLAATDSLVVSLLALTLALNLGEYDLTWGRLAVSLPLALSVTWILGLTWIELRIASTLLVPIKLLATRAMLPIILTGFYTAWCVAFVSWSALIQILSQKQIFVATLCNPVLH